MSSEIADDFDGTEEDDPEEFEPELSDLGHIQKSISQLTLNSNPEGVCPACEGMGLRVVQDAKGNRKAVRCECYYSTRAIRTIQRAQIPRRYENCTFESYATDFPGVTRSVPRASEFMRKYVAEYMTTRGSGILITGGVGTGKTHLAVATLRALITEYRAVGLFYDYSALLKQVQNTYNSSVSQTEFDVLAPVFQADVLVLDELGFVKRTDWAWDMVSHILNTRYNDRKTTIFTTNYPNEPPASAAPPSPEGRSAATLTGETLGDRIGERMFSRIQEMCHVIEMKGGDFRKGVKRPTL